MPFITPEKREQIDRDFRLAEDKGDACYVIYKVFVTEFKANPRWTTIHNLYKDKVVDTFWLYRFRTNDKYTYNDWIAGLHLAWQVFFTVYVMPYELEKMETNGDI